MKIVLAYDPKTNSFIVAEAPAGITVKSRCENSMAVTTIMVTVPEDVMVREACPEVFDAMKEEMAGKQTIIDEMAAQLKDKEDLIEEMNNLGQLLQEKYQEATTELDKLKEELSTITGSHDTEEETKGIDPDPAIAVSENDQSPADEQPQAPAEEIATEGTDG